MSVRRTNDYRRKFILRILNDEQEANHLQISEDFLKGIEENPKFFPKVVTVDETNATRKRKTLKSGVAHNQLSSFEKDP